MLLREDFYLFYTKFSYFIGEEKILANYLKPNLRYKLNAELYKAIMPSYDSYIDYVALIRLF
jgi:hypothetical protein